MMQTNQQVMREIARFTLQTLDGSSRAAMLGELLAAEAGDQALERLSKLRAVISLRMQELINEKYPLDAMIQAYPPAEVLQARFGAATGAGA
jgi:hypothetical protein